VTITAEGVRKWCKTRNFGVKVFGRWRIPPVRIEAIATEIEGAASCPASKG